MFYCRIWNASHAEEEGARWVLNLNVFYDLTATFACHTGSQTDRQRVRQSCRQLISCHTMAAGGQLLPRLIANDTSCAADKVSICHDTRWGVCGKAPWEGEEGAKWKEGGGVEAPPRYVNLPKIYENLIMMMLSCNFRNFIGVATWKMSRDDEKWVWNCPQSECDKRQSGKTRQRDEGRQRESQTNCTFQAAFHFGVFWLLTNYFVLVFYFDKW